MPIDLILPCLNEAAALPWVLGRLPAGVRAVVVDNGSTDGSAGIAADHGATVVHCPVKGYGAACHAGLEASTAEVVAFLDADASLDPQQLARVTAPVESGTADLMLGRRRPVSREAWPWHLRLANAELSRRIRRRTGLRRFGREPAAVTCCWLYGAALLVATPAYPWYGLPLIALAVLAGRPEWLAVPLATYVAYANYGHETRQGLIHLLAALIVLGVLVRRSMRARRLVSALSPTVT